MYMPKNRGGFWLKCYISDFYGKKSNKHLLFGFAYGIITAEICIFSIRVIL